MTQTSNLKCFEIKIIPDMEFAYTVFAANEYDALEKAEVQFRNESPETIGFGECRYKTITRHVIDPEEIAEALVNEDLEGGEDESEEEAS